MNHTLQERSYYLILTVGWRLSNFSPQATGCLSEEPHNWLGEQLVG